MESTADRAIAIVGTGAVLPDARNVAEFWNNVKTGRYSITDTPANRWSIAHYYDPDHSAPDKTYSKIGGWVKESPWDPAAWKLPIPPKVADAMDDGQKWAIACTYEALADYGYPKRSLNLDRAAVILGNAMGGEKHYLTSLRVFFPEYAAELEQTESFMTLPESLRRDIRAQLRDRMSRRIPGITEDTMPGELANCIAGRIANVFNCHGPNFTTDAACASAMAAISAATEGLTEHYYDVAITGGIDRNMGAPSFVKFCKIGALSATGTRPYAEGADGFVMGEGAAVFVMKRLADAERDGDRIYAVLRGIGGASDGRGKGITAPNPAGQKICVERAWEAAGLDPSTATLIEGHGTSTTVGDYVEATALSEVLAAHNAKPHSIALGSVKSNIGHLKGSAGAAGFLKATLAIRDKVMPPSIHCEKRNPNVDFANSALYVNTELREWTAKSEGVRRAAVSAFGFGGTNFHAVLEEYVPGRLKSANGNGKVSVAVNGGTHPAPVAAPTAQAAHSAKPPLRGALVIGAATKAELASRLSAVNSAAQAGRAPAPSAPKEAELKAAERIAIDYGAAAELADRSAKALNALAADQPLLWKALRSQGVFRGSGAPGKIAFLYTGQGSQYVNMMKSFRAAEPLVAETFAEADRVLSHLLGKPLSDFIFVNSQDPAAVAKAENDLRQTAITQPAVLATDISLTKLMASYGVKPDMVMGHSLGEYGALVAAGCLPFEDALEAVSARGREMTRVSMKDNGKMAAVFAPIKAIEEVISKVDGYVVIANINSNQQAVVGGESPAVEAAVKRLKEAGYEAVLLPVSHAFHTSIVAPASEPLRNMLMRLRLTTPKLPIIANVNGEFYPTDNKPAMLDILARQVAAPVQFVKGLETLYNAGARIFCEMGPKKALQGFADEVLGDRPGVLSLFSNHPKIGDVVAFNQALCGMYASGIGAVASEEKPAVIAEAHLMTKSVQHAELAQHLQSSVSPSSAMLGGNQYETLGRMMAEVFERAGQMMSRGGAAPVTEPPVVTGAGLGLPGTERVFDDRNLRRILNGEQLIGPMPDRYRRAILDKHITRLVKSDKGGPTFETIDDVKDVIKLAGRGGDFNLERDFGVPADRVAALDRVTRLAIGAGLEAMCDAGIPLVMRYKTTTTGTQLPSRWGLPDALRDDTGIIFASAFPGYNAYADEMGRYYADKARREQLEMIEILRARVEARSPLAMELDRKRDELRRAIEAEPYAFDRRFILKVLPMGHSQFAELIGARGPNAQINTACASTTSAVSVANDWIRTGRCRRVIVVSGDDITHDQMVEWFGAGFLATGAAATDAVVEEAATPFDRRRHGMIMGMGAAAIVVESVEAARERGVRPICRVLNSITANSAYHGTRLDVDHICGLMEQLVAGAEARGAVSRRQMAERLVFVSHETYTPARGGSAAAEIHALRRVFGDAADRIVIANTKGFTGHAMGAGIEDVIAIRALETGCVPPVPNFKEVDPELGQLNLSKGGVYPVEYSLRLGAGFGSQIAMTLMQSTPAADQKRPVPEAIGYAGRITDPSAWDNWLAKVAGRPAAELEVVNRTLRVRDAAGSRLSMAAAAGAPAPAPVRYAAPPPAPPKPEPAPAPAPPKPAVAAAPAPALDPVQERVLGVVAEKTGYPKDMLALDLDLEADLGIDTVKQAEVFAAIREAYGIARDENLRLREFPTLAHVIQFVKDRTPKSEATPVVTPAPPVADAIQEQVLAIVAEKTGYPRDMLALDLDLEADLGIDTVKQAEMFAAIRAAYDIPRDENLRLREFPTLAHVIQFAKDRRPDLVVATVAVAPAPAPAAPAVDAIQERVLAIVSEKTGYPRDMLALDLDLEADLGIDTVKQAEMFAAIRAAYDIPRDENLRLRDFPTLAHVIQFAKDRRPDLAVATVAVAPTPAPAAPAVDAIQERVLGIVSEKTGYPRDMLALDLDLEADLGIDTVKQAEMFAAIRAAYDIPRDENLRLRDFPTLAHVIQFAKDRRPDLAVATVAVAPSAPLAAAPSEDPIAEKVLAIVSEKTGYPRDMLALDLDLEADLGIDTVKQAEMFAAIRAAYNIPRDENLKLRDFPTLAHVIGFAKQSAPVADTPAPSAPQPAVADPIAEKVLEIVSEKTGYPRDMLALDLDLEADLGVDTVKQAEMFAAIRAAYNIPRDENLKLRDFPTLAHVIGFARERSGAAPVAAPEASTPAEASKPAPVAATFEAANHVPRRVPVPCLRPSLDHFKPTGVTLAAGARAIVVQDRGGVAAALEQQLKMQGVEVLLLDSSAERDAIVNLVKEWSAAGPIAGVYWLPALDDEGGVAEMDLQAWRAALHVRVKTLYSAMRALYDRIAAADTFLVSATRLGGQHGYDAAGATSPMGGAVTGFTKAYKRERVEALVKAVDFEPTAAANDIACLLIAETLHDAGAVEIGYQAGQRWSVGLRELPVADGQPGMPLYKDSVFVVTGAAGSITSAITTDLAAASGGAFYLLDLVPEPQAGNPDLIRFVADKEGLKRELFARIQARGERATPAMVERELAGIERAVAAQTTIDAVHAAGGTAHYFSVDLRDGEAVARVISQVRERSGKVDVLMHAAGIERSRFLPDKEPAEFDLVFDIKSDGWFNLLRAIGDMPLGATVGFSSIAGRFGNGGQTDYSSANDLLCKFASSFRTVRPATRGIVVDWTAWGGIGMATRGSIPKMMEMAGIDMLPMEAGIPWVRRELTQGGTRGEVVVAQRLGILTKEADPTGGLVLSAAAEADRGPMLGEVASLSLYNGLTVNTTLNPTEQPFLFDHMIEGLQVLPGVMGMEAFAEAAAALAPGWTVDAVENVDFLAPFKFYRNEPRTATVEAQLYAEGANVVAYSKLVGRRTLPGQSEPQETVHFTGRVRLVRAKAEAPRIRVPVAPEHAPVDAEAVYKVYFHGPAYRVVHRAWNDNGVVAAEMPANLPDNHRPPERPLTIAPRLAELCFQTAGLYELSRQGRMALPRHVGSVRAFGDAAAAGPLTAIARPNPADESFDVDVVDAAGNVYLEMRSYRTVQLPGPVDTAPLKALNEPAA